MTETFSSSVAQQAAARVDEAAAAGKISPPAAGNLKIWLTKPAYHDYQARLLDLIDRGRFGELDSLFWEVIPFGTGGRRGRMADLGSATINDRTIAESADGMANYLKTVKGKAGGRAVIAHDTRNRSVDFARITATTLAAHGLTVFLFEGPRSTPELSFAVRHLQCDIGAMISASHNPPADNGFKAYWSNGAQVLPPHDRGIIDCVVNSGEIPKLDFDAAVSSGSIQIIGESLDRAYVDSVAAMSLSRERDVRALFTPFHGVGETSVYRLLRETGFSQVEIFEPQRTLDGNFPHVPGHFPNPELAAAFTTVIEEAHKLGSDVVLASDPDADRLGVVARTSDGRYVHLTGNQVAAILADYILQKRSAAGRLSADDFVCTTLVTTPLLRTVSEPFGVRVIDDLLVGFKYIAQTMEALGPQQFVFGCEESLGYLAGSYCRDKDAAIAALYLLERAAELKCQGKTLLDGLDELYEKVGYFLEGQRSESCQGPRGKDQIDALMQTLRTRPPQRLGGVTLAQMRDYRDQTVRDVPSGRTSGPLSTAKGDLLFLDSADGPDRFSIAVRPSGTEPKIKFYFFARGKPRGGEALPDLKLRLEQAMSEFQDSLSQWVQQVLNSDTRPPGEPSR